MTRASRFLAGLAALLCWEDAAFAGEAADFDAKLSDALGQYRDAYVHSAPPLAEVKTAAEALAAFAQTWKSLAERWAAHAPPQFSEDANFARELDDIAQVTAQAQAQAKGGALEQAHATLGEVRALLAEMRRRNGLHGFADEMDAFDDRLAEITDDPFEDEHLSPEQTQQLLEQTAVLAYLGERIEKQSPSSLADDANFLSMAEEMNRQVAALKWLALAGQRAPVLAALKDMRAHFNRLWLFYGE